MTTATSRSHGVDLRLNTHTESLDYENGFGEVIREAFRRRHGVDISRDAFDRAAWRRLRGEHLDQLITEVSTAVPGRGAQMLVQLQDDFARGPEEICFLETFCDWRGWIERGLIDVANLAKAPLREPFYAAAVAHCRAHGVQTMLTPAMHWAADAAGPADRRRLHRPLPVGVAAAGARRQVTPGDRRRREGPQVAPRPRRSRSCARHRAIAAWSPESSASGTATPRNSRGRV